MLALRKLFKFPGPSTFSKDASDYALQSRNFSPDVNKDVYCWEDYYADLKKTYPIRYFLAETLADFLRYKILSPITRPFKNFKYWLISHVVPSRKYHMLDLRQPKNDNDNYRYGWLDTDHRMLYANFNLLNEFVTHEMSNFYCPSLVECDDENCGASNKAQRDVYFTILDLHNWWNNYRKMEAAANDALQHAWYERRHKHKIFDEETDRLWTAHLAADEAFLEKETEMLIRLIKIRKSLWT